LNLTHYANSIDEWRVFVYEAALLCARHTECAATHAAEAGATGTTIRNQPLETGPATW